MTCALMLFDCGIRHTIYAIRYTNLLTGIADITANIMGSTKRDLDAFYLIHGEDQIRFHQRGLGTTNPKYFLPNLPKGKYEIEYTVISSNFDTVSKRLIIDFHEGYEKLEFKEA